MALAGPLCATGCWPADAASSRQATFIPAFKERWPKWANCRCWLKATIFFALGQAGCIGSAGCRRRLCGRNERRLPGERNRDGQHGGRPERDRCGNCRGAGGLVPARRTDARRFVLGFARGGAVGKHLQIEGPACTVSVACASGAMSIALGANMLLDGAAPMVLAGGSDALCPFTLSGFNSLQALDEEPCRPFDQNRKGLNLGEGAAVLVLETLADATKRGVPIQAVLRGWAMTNDASHPTAPHNEGAGLAACIRLAMEMARLRLDDIGYVNAHGTGTPLNDIAETHAFEPPSATAAAPFLSPRRNPTLDIAWARPELWRRPSPSSRS